MMSIAHLWWIIPLAFIAGYMVCACLAVGKRADERMEQIMKDKEEQSDH